MVQLLLHVQSKYIELVFRSKNRVVPIKTPKAKKAPLKVSTRTVQPSQTQTFPNIATTTTTTTTSTTTTPSRSHLFTTARKPAKQSNANTHSTSSDQILAPKTPVRSHVFTTASNANSHTSATSTSSDHTLARPAHLSATANGSDSKQKWTTVTSPATSHTLVTERQAHKANRLSIDSNQSSMSSHSDSSGISDASMKNQVSRDGSGSSRRIEQLDQSQSSGGTGLKLEDCGGEGEEEEDYWDSFPFTRPGNSVKTNGLSIWKTWR